MLTVITICVSLLDHRKALLDSIFVVQGHTMVTNAEKLYIIINSVHKHCTLKIQPVHTKYTLHIQPVHTKYTLDNVHQIYNLHTCTYIICPHITSTKFIECLLSKTPGFLNPSSPSPSLHPMSNDDSKMTH